jgi:hypothetical protein
MVTWPKRHVRACTQNIQYQIHMLYKYVCKYVNIYNYIYIYIYLLYTLSLSLYIYTYICIYIYRMFLHIAQAIYVQIPWDHMGWDLYHFVLVTWDNSNHSGWFFLVALPSIDMCWIVKNPGLLSVSSPPNMVIIEIFPGINHQIIQSTLKIKSLYISLGNHDWKFPR